MGQAVAAVLGATLLTSLLPAAYGDPAGVRVELSWRPDGVGRTILDFPPLGELQAHTHTVPLAIRMRLLRVEPSVVDALAAPASGGGSGYAALSSRLATFGRHTLVRFAARQALLGAAGAALGVYAVGIREVSTLAGWGGGGLAAVVAVEAAVVKQLNLAAFDAPRVVGVLEAVPRLVGIARQGLQAVGDIGRRLQLGVAQLLDLYRRLEQAGPVALPAEEWVVAHVSDLHNNPAGYELMAAVVRHFGVSLVIDTGDIADWGTPLEASLVRQLRQVPVPYLYVAGNHDTPAVLKALAALPNVRVLRGEPVVVNGIEIVGVPDPGAAGAGPEALTPEAADDLAGVIAARWQPSTAPRRPGHPRLLAVHNHRVAEAVPPGLFDAVLYGHDHRQRLMQREGTAYVDAGSTGAEGVRALESQRPGLFTLALLRFARDPRGARLWAVDLLKLDGVTGQVSMERQLVATGGEARSAVEALPGESRPVPAR